LLTGSEGCGVGEGVPTVLRVGIGRRGDVAGGGWVDGSELRGVGFAVLVVGQPGDEGAGFGCLRNGKLVAVYEEGEGVGGGGCGGGDADAEGEVNRDGD
jgi:hypothetical protein